MPLMPENFGLDFFENDDELSEILNGFAVATANNGKVLAEYNNNVKFYKKYGDIDVYVSLKTLEEEKRLELDKLDLHCSGPTVWELECTDIDMSRDKDLPSGRLIMMKSEKGNGGIFPVNLVNADMLPSFLKGDVVKAQICAFPVDVHYYANEEEYEDSTPADDEGKKYMVAKGHIIPLDFLVNHSVSKEDLAKKIQKEQCDNDDIVHLTAEVKNAVYGSIELGGNIDKAFIRTFVETKYGDLMIVHSAAQIQESEIKNIRPGAIISCASVLSADCCIYSYENGVVSDFDNNLRALRYSLVKGNADRLRRILDEKVVYESDNHSTVYNGINDVINKLNSIQEKSSGKYDSSLGTVTGLSSTSGNTDTEYPVGTRCIVMICDNKYESAVFINTNEEGKITRIKVSSDERYCITLDNAIRLNTMVNEEEYDNEMGEQHV